ncbi:MAG: hypothetical protein HQ574_00205 [Chloroflexi bacterium]|nr:hypothetical protein [Chloroflexota bacterium]
MPGNVTTSNIPQEKGRPLGITLLSILYLIISFFHLFKFLMVVLQYSSLSVIPITVSPIYLAASGLIWGLSGIFLFWSLWKGKPWASPAAIALSLIFCLVFWMDRIWIADPISFWTRWPFNLAITFIGLGGLLLVLNQKSSRRFFRKNPAKIT